VALRQEHGCLLETWSKALWVRRYRKRSLCEDSSNCSGSGLYYCLNPSLLFATEMAHMSEGEGWTLKILLLQIRLLVANRWGYGVEERTKSKGSWTSSAFINDFCSKLHVALPILKFPFICTLMACLPPMKSRVLLSHIHLFCAAAGTVFLHFCLFNALSSWCSAMTSPPLPTTTSRSLNSC